MSRVLFIFGTRPEAIKLAPLILELEARANIEPVVCVTGQHREMLDQVLDVFDLRPDYDLNVMQAGQSLTDVTVRILEKLGAILQQVAPDLVVVVGDTTTTMAGALAAFHSQIPVAHVESGLRTGHRYNPFPEEMYRTVVDVLAELHFAPTEQNRENLLRAGIGPESISVTGNTVIDALLQAVARIDTPSPDDERANEFLCQIPVDMRARLADNADGHRLILVTGHRRESFGRDFESICLALRDIASRHRDVEIAYAVHMNPNVREPVYRILGDAERVQLFEPPDYLGFVWLLAHAYLVLTDSGGIQEEAPSLGKPLLVMRRATERPEGIEAGCAKLVGVDRASIAAEATRLLEDPAAYEAMSVVKNPYGDGRASVRIADAIEAWLATNE